ncbi:MAG: hypothetical protein ACI841_004775 [Planctomycetota bacterium]|jgi:hypothetical protein
MHSEVDIGLAEERLFQYLQCAVDEGSSDRRELESTLSLDLFLEDPRFGDVMSSIPSDS